MKIQHVEPEDIEKRSMEIIEGELNVNLSPLHKTVVKRIIHTTADFSFAESMFFSNYDGLDAVQIGLATIKAGAKIITDTNMAKAGINKKALKKFGGEAFCFMADKDVVEAAKENASTRAVASMDKASKLEGKLIFALGNAPTALIRLCELIKEGAVKPELVIGVPVGFVNIVESKELLMQSGVPCIVSTGRKGGSAVAAAICNSLLYME